MASLPTSDCVKLGDYIVIQKQNYRKLHKFNKPNSSINLGRDSVNLNGIEGHKYYSYFKLLSTSSRKSREYSIEFTEETVNLKDEIDIKVSGSDNRNILDDGRSQKLTAADIEVLKTDGNKASDIVETLITNSNTFHNKTEFSQEKYLKKKEKKYFEYIQILKPNLRMISEIMYKLEPSKIQHLRIDTLSQILTQANIYSDGVYLLYDSGSNGLLSAAILSAIGENTTGKLIHMHPGNMSQKQALLAMNFKEEQLNRCISVNVYSALRQYYQGTDVNKELNVENPLKRKLEEEDEERNSKVAKIDEGQTETENNSEESNKTTLPEPKKPKWHFENIAAADLLKNKVDGLIIASKEDPQNIFKELVDFVNPGRPFVVYYVVAEPLQHMYMALKSMANVSALNLTCNWLRNYQVLPERTHPEVMMNASSGFMLSGYILK